MEINNLYTNETLKLVPGKELFEKILKTGNFFVERIISPGNCPSKEWMIQDWTELVFLIKGSATIEFEGNQTIELKEGDYCSIPKQLAHRVIKTNDLQTIWLAIHYEEN